MSLSQIMFFFFLFFLKIKISIAFVRPTKKLFIKVFVAGD